MRLIILSNSLINNIKKKRQKKVFSNWSFGSISKIPKLLKTLIVACTDGLEQKLKLLMRLENTIQ